MHCQIENMEVFLQNTDLSSTCKIHNLLSSNFNYLSYFHKGIFSSSPFTVSHSFTLQKWNRINNFSLPLKHHTLGRNCHFFMAQERVSKSLPGRTAEICGQRHHIPPLTVKTSFFYFCFSKVRNPVECYVFQMLFHRLLCLGVAPS